MESINKSRYLGGRYLRDNSNHSPILPLRSAPASFRSSGINFKLEFTISHVDAHSTLLIIVGKGNVGRNGGIEGEKEIDIYIDRIRQKLSGFC